MSLLDPFTSTPSSLVRFGGRRVAKVFYRVSDNAFTCAKYFGQIILKFICMSVQIPRRLIVLIQPSACNRQLVRHTFKNAVFALPNSTAPFRSARHPGQEFEVLFVCRRRVISAPPRARFHFFCDWQWPAVPSQLRLDLLVAFVLLFARLAGPRWLICFVFVKLCRH